APFREGWDRLAVENAKPLAAPAWMLGWWRHAAPDGAQLRTIVVLDGDDVVGVAPYFVQSARGGRIDYRLLASTAAERICVLADPGREDAAAETIAETLAAASPRPDLISFEGTDASSPW